MPTAASPLPGVPASSHARLTLSHPSFAVDEVTVDTTPGRPTPSHLRGWDLTTVPSLLHPHPRARAARAGEGHRQGDRQAAGRHARRDDAVPRQWSTRPSARAPTRTAATRSRGHHANQYWTTVYPPPDSGYISIEEQSVLAGRREGPERGLRPATRPAHSRPGRPRRDGRAHRRFRGRLPASLWQSERPARL